MAIDYSILDIRSFFTPHEAAMAWCEISELTKENQHNYRHIYHEIAEAIRTGELRAEIPVTYHDSWITRECWTTRHPEQAKITREDLMRWAEARSQKPKFLFPETRTKELALVVSDVTAIVAEAPIHANQKRLAAWKAEAVAIWNEHPSYTQGQVATIIRTNMLANKKGGYSEKAIIRAIAPLDTRENRVGKRKQLIDS